MEKLGDLARFKRHFLSFSGNSANPAEILRLSGRGGEGGEVDAPRPLLDLCLYFICRHNDEPPGTSFDREFFPLGTLSKVSDGAYCRFRLCFDLNLHFLRPCRRHERLFKKSKRSRGLSPDRKPPREGHVEVLSAAKTHGGLSPAEIELAYFCDGCTASFVLNMYHVPDLTEVLNLLSYCVNKDGISRFICRRSLTGKDKDFRVSGRLLYGVEGRMRGSIMSIYNSFALRPDKNRLLVRPFYNTAYLQDNLREVGKDGDRIYERFTVGNMNYKAHKDPNTQMRWEGH